MNIFECDPATKLKWYTQKLRELVDEMDAQGLVATVERAPLLPLAMGNHIPLVKVRLARGLYNAREIRDFTPTHASLNSDGSVSLGGYYAPSEMNRARGPDGGLDRHGLTPLAECKCGQCSLCRARK